MNKCSSCGTELTVTSRFCPSCGAPTVVAASGVEGTSPRESGHSQTSVFRRVGLIAFPLIVVGGGILFYLYIRPSTHSVIKQQPVVSAAADYESTTLVMTPVSFKLDGNDIVFPLRDLLEHRFIRFEYPAKNIVRPIMAYIDPQGRLVTAISLSDHCGSTEFTIKDNQIYCAHCPSHWDMMTMEAYACCANYYPDPIPSTVVGDEIRISKAVVEKWTGRL